ncbi:hypothetical protein [Cellulosimicrobium composti]|nr:hypothetical protein [Cellulosimicrobium composti]
MGTIAAGTVAARWAGAGVEPRGAPEGPEEPGVRTEVTAQIRSYEG